ncbi:MAG: dTDP-4-dehydrorhamnose reductase [Acidobacteriota bacterium]|jgi:dTDP-4-dehydrorhamnose reductase|nr:dTDP-4-dehydrorhamnose reductase [Acidobacteriota bacterium]
MGKNTVWLIGDKGMLGAELAPVLEGRGFPVVGTDREVDVTDAAALRGFAQGKGFAWIVNCAAYTAVDKAEDDAQACRRLNTDGAGNIAAAAHAMGARLIHIATDYVFDGRGVVEPGAAAPRPYREDDATAPIGVYGATKRDGERAVAAVAPDSYIVRTAWLYGRHGNNFVRTMLRLMKERDAVSVVDDQRGSPTWAFDLAGAVAAFAAAAAAGRPAPYGIYHYTDEGAVTWFDFAREIHRQGRALGLLDKDCDVRPCTSAEFPAKVTRPAYSVLDKGKVKAALGLDIPDWRASLGRYLSQG